MKLSGGPTPMMTQYREIKSRHPDKILFFRLGDFYEMFLEDAEVAARELGITLTSREVGKGQGRVPMAGVPHHAADGYLATLLEKGYRVAICEQVEDPRSARGLVRREVVRVVTPGTVLDTRSLKEKQNNYLVLITAGERPPAYGLAVLDFSTGEFRVSELRGPRPREALLDELARLEPAEILLEGVGQLAGDLERLYPGRLAPAPRIAGSYTAAEMVLREHFACPSLEPFGCQGMPLAVAAAGALLAYAKETSLCGATQVTRLVTRPTAAHMLLDAATCRNLELVRTLRDGGRKGTLLWVLDQTLTGPGGRRLRQWLLQPLVDRAEIGARHDAVAELVAGSLLRGRLREILSQVQDLERLAGRVAGAEANARDLVSLAATLELLPDLGSLLVRATSPRLAALGNDLPDLGGLARLLKGALVDSPPVAVKEGGVIRDGYNAGVDRLREVAGGGKDWVAALEARERERTGIKSLKVGFNRVFGYYLEVTRPNLAQVPADFERRQTLAGAERFVTPELKEREALILDAEERLATLEYELFLELRQAVVDQCAAIQAAASSVAEADALATLADVAVSNGYVRPEIVDRSEVTIVEGRHPVVERLLPGRFVPNDVRLDGEGERLVVLTGPNMAGKSTYCRMTALICVMAQMGGFVPAASARLGPVDRIFTRIGATDDLVMGQSTFMIEMQEVANILSNATPRSLAILDEIGRGTSTFDGLSIAWAVAEHLLAEAPLTLFATHYHELTGLEGTVPGAANYSVAVRESGDEVVFLYRVVRGGADRSYGIHVARLAGLPPAVRERARSILESLEASREHEEARRQAAASRPRTVTQFQLFEGRRCAVREELKGLNILALSPLEALNLLYRLQERARAED
ncbi:MAG: DNA mismatch repair protein MutS [bacterium]|nr:DNA mismatch repair protein MutS [bacterium]